MTLLINNETLGSEEYIGTREEFIEAMTPTPLIDWYDEYQMEVFEMDEHLLYQDWLDHIMDRGLRLATGEEIARFPRIAP